MSALQRSIGSRLLPATFRPSVTRSIAPKYRTYADASNESAPNANTNEAPNAPLDHSSVQDREQTTGKGMTNKP